MRQKIRRGERKKNVLFRRTKTQIVKDIRAGGTATLNDQVCPDLRFGIELG